MTHLKILFDYSFQATVLGYHPFIKFSPLEYLAVFEMHGRWGFEQILPKLGNLENINRPWAVRFLGTADRLPRNDVLEAPNLREFITSSELWQRNNEYKRDFWATFFRVYKRMKKAHKTMPPPLRTAYKEDLSRWRRHLKEQNEKRKDPAVHRPASFSSERAPKIKRPEPIIVYKKKEPKAE